MRSAFPSMRPQAPWPGEPSEAAREMGPGPVRKLRGALLDSLIAVDESEGGRPESGGA